MQLVNPDPMLAGPSEDLFLYLRALSSSESIGTLGLAKLKEKK